MLSTQILAFDELVCLETCASGANDAGLARANTGWSRKSAGGFGPLGMFLGVSAKSNDQKRATCKHKSRMKHHEI